MIFPRILALAAFLVPLGAAAPAPSAEQPRFTAVLDNWRISYRDEPGHVHLGISIMLPRRNLRHSFLAASEGYPPFRLQATLLSITPSAKESRGTFKLQGHHGNPHFSGFHVEGGTQVMSNKDAEDETAHLITYSFPQPPVL